jgi:hypothetical protein
MDHEKGDVHEISNAGDEVKQQPVSKESHNDQIKIKEQSEPSISDNIAVSEVNQTPLFSDDFLVRPPLYMKGVPVADNIKNRLLMREIDREVRLEEKIAKTHNVEKFFPYPPPVSQVNRVEFASDKSAHTKAHQRELHEWHNEQKRIQRKMNEDFKQEHGHRTKLNKRVERAPPSDEVTRWKEKTHVKRWGSKKKHMKESNGESEKRRP